MTDIPNMDDRWQHPHAHPVVTSDHRDGDTVQPLLVTVPAHDIFAQLSDHLLNASIGAVAVSGPALDNADDEVRIVADRPGHNFFGFLDLVSDDYQWSASGSGTNEYYLEAAGGGDPGVSEPQVIYEDDTAIANGTAGSLSAGEWDWADNDTLGYSTVYVRLSDGADPDSKADGYVQKDSYVDGPASAWGGTQDGREWGVELILPNRLGLRPVDDLWLQLSARQSSATDLQVTPIGL